MIRRITILATSLLVLSSSLTRAAQPLPPEVRQELSSLLRELRGVSAMVRRDEVEEARSVIETVEERLEELAIPEDERDRTLSSLKTQLERAKASIPVSFESEVAPILKDNCLRCHGADRASAGLRMHTFNAMAAGGRSGAVARARLPARSLIMARVMTDDTQARMPRGGSRLSDEDINTLGRWIQQGLRFDGEDRNAPIGESLIPKKPPVEVVMADGTESVSFKDDVAPWMVSICLGCHSGNNPRGGYSIATFEQVLTDGDSGSTIVPGRPDDSYICDLVLRQDPIKMPAGQALLKRSQAKALETWIAEGARFDGTDPKAPLRSLVPTPAEMEAARLAALSDEEFAERRRKQAEDIWKRVAPRVEVRSESTDNLLLYGSVSAERLTEIGNWGEQQIEDLTSRYPVPDGEPVWRGRLIVFVTEARFDYEEFNAVLMNGRRTPPSISGHVVITPNVDEAWVAMHDTGDVASAERLPARELLATLLAEAYLRRDGSRLPDWLTRGFGIAEAGLAPNSEYVRNLPNRAAAALPAVSNPAALFDDGTFAPEDTPAIGYLLVRFLIAKGGGDRFQQLVQVLRTEANVGQALQRVYDISAANLGTAFLRSGGR